MAAIETRDCKYDVIIVGAGLNGLCAAHTFLALDSSLSLLVLDARASIGGVWSRQQLYPHLHANNVQGYYEFSDFPMLDASIGASPREKITGEMMESYLQKFADHFNLMRHVRLRTKVLTARELSAGDKTYWELEIAKMDDSVTNEARKVTSSKLVLATGRFSDPFVPQFPGRSSFGRLFIHTSDLAKHSSTMIEDPEIREVVVLGGSKSAHDAAYIFGTAGKHVTLLVSKAGRGTAPMAKPFVRIGPLSAWLEGLLMMRPMTWLCSSPWTKDDGFGWIRWLLRRTRLGNEFVKSFFGIMTYESYKQSGLLDSKTTSTMVPDQTILWAGSQTGILNYDGDFYELVRDSKVTFVRGDVDSLGPGSVRLDDGRSLQADAIVCATGFNITSSVPLEPSSNRLEWGCPVESSKDHLFPDLDARADREILHEFPLVRSSPSPASRQSSSSFTPWRLWRFMVPPAQAPLPAKKRNLLFLNTVVCYQAAIMAQLSSLWAYAYLNDKLDVKKPTRDESFYETSLWTRFCKWSSPYGGHGMYADFHVEALPFYDLLLRDLGLRSWRKGWGILGEIFGGRYEVRDYKDVREEWSMKNAANSF